MQSLLEVDAREQFRIPPGWAEAPPPLARAPEGPRHDVDINFEDPATIFEIMFPAAQNRDTVYSRDANLDLDSLYRRPNEPEPVD